MEWRKILLVEDSKDCQTLVHSVLGKKYSVRCVGSAELALRELRASRFDLLILDIGLPGIDGFQLCAEIKTIEAFENIPVIFLTSRATVEDKILGFSVGADDFIPKPFDIRELGARVDSKLRRQAQHNSQRDNYVLGRFRISPSRQKVFLITADDEQDLGLGSMEFKLFLYFIQHEGHILSRSQILDNVWGLDVHVRERTVDTHVYTLRKKLASQAVAIKSIPGEGYQFILPAA